MQVLITGTGTLARALLDEYKDVQITTITNDEEQWHQVKVDYPHVNSVLADIRDDIDKYFNDKDEVIHTAALKHVPSGEQFPIESVRTNVFGTWNVAKACQKHNVKKAVFISSDKAIYPTNVYGATKLIGERIFLSYGYSVCRFGNFWGSRGSVIPLWEQQVKENKPITITDPNMTRYFIYPRDAAKFVIEKLKSMDYFSEPKVYIPMMKPYRLGSLATMLHPDYPIKIIGKRPGEKMDEVLDYDNL